MEAYADTEGKANGWAIAGGIVLLLAGFASILAPVVAAGAVALLLPIVLLIKGVAELVSVFRAHTAGAVIWRILVGIISIVAGLALLARPFLAFLTLETILIAYLLVEGVVRLVAAFVAERGSRAVLALSGIVSLLLGALLWAQPFNVTILLIGIFIGIDLVTAGAALIAGGVSERRHERPSGLAPA